jgi:hypothetical protein
MIDLKKALSAQAEMPKFETYDIAEMAKIAKADSLRLVQNAAGKEYLHILNSKTGEHFKVGFGKNVNLVGTTAEERIGEVVKNYVIYGGTTDNGNWFTFGTIPTGKEAVVVSIGSILSQMETA